MHDDHDDDHGQSALARDLKLISERRQFLRWMAALSLAPVIGCPSNDDNSSDAGQKSGSKSTTSSNPKAGTNSASCNGVIPEETEGPYPGDGTNGPNALSLSGIVRSDITSSLGGASGKAAGVPLAVKLKLVDAKNACVPLAGYAVYLWHCDRDGNYSMYSPAVASENYLRGVQEADNDGSVTFNTIYPGCYSGRWPHIHFEIYESLDAATTGKNKVATSQLAMPEATCKEVYAASGYSTSVTNLSMISLASDNVFSDGATLETPSTSGSASAGYTATLTVAINA